MPNVKQALQIMAAGAGMIAIFAFMAHLMYSGAQRYQSSAQEMREDHGDSARLVYDRAQELREALNLTREQMVEVEHALVSYEYGLDDSRWRRERDRFYAEIGRLLTDEQRVQLSSWQQSRERDRSDSGFWERRRRRDRVELVNDVPSPPQEDSRVSGD